MAIKIKIVDGKIIPCFSERVLGSINPSSRSQLLHARKLITYDMEIIKIRNAENKDTKKEFGCKCPRCGTSFIFTMNDVISPRKFNYSMNECTVTCPNHSCNDEIYLASSVIVELTNEDEKKKFIKENK